MHAVGLGRRPHRVEVARVVGLGRRRRQQDGAEAAGGDALDLGDGVVDVGERNRARSAPGGRSTARSARRRSRCRRGRAPSRARGRRSRARTATGSGASPRRRRRRSPCPRGSSRGRLRASARRSGGSGRSSSPRSRACAAAGRSGPRPRRAARSRSRPPRPPRSRRCFGRRVTNRSVGSRRCPSAEMTSCFSVMVVPFLRGTQDLVPNERPGVRAVLCAPSVDQPVGTGNARQRVADGRGQEEKEP